LTNDQEQGLDVIARICGSKMAGCTLEDAMRNPEDQLAWLGAFMLTHWWGRGWKLLDDLCRGCISQNHRLYAHKTASFIFDPGFSARYVERSDIFTDHLTIVCQRDPQEAYDSGRRRFPYWKGVIDWDRFQAEYDRFYAAVEAAGVLVLQHSRISADPTAAAALLSQSIGASCQPAPWVSHNRVT